MKIALLHFRCYETDGVSLEMDKWAKAIELLGYTCMFIAGNHPENGSEYFEFRHPEIAKITSKCFFGQKESIEELKEEISNLKLKCYKEIEKLFTRLNPDVLVVNNIFSLPINIPFTIALTEYLEEHRNIKCIGFQHDFYWERDYYKPTSDFS